MYVPNLTGNASGLTGGSSPAVAVATQQVTYTVNALGDNKTLTDRNGSVHTFTFDVLGRQISDTVTTLGNGVDGGVRRIDTAFDSADRPYLFTSYSDTAGSTIVNQVQDVFKRPGPADHGIPGPLRRREHRHDAQRPVRLHRHGRPC
jgi:hypothetical protein